MGVEIPMGFCGRKGLIEKKDLEGGMKVLNEAVKALEGENDKNQKTSATSKMQTTESRSEYEDDDEEPFEELETVSDCQ